MLKFIDIMHDYIIVDLYMLIKFIRINWINQSINDTEYICC